MNSIQQILQCNFSSISLEKKMEIKNTGRPTPDLNIKQITKCKTRDYVRQFKNDIYKKHDWTCGCSETNCLCIIFPVYFLVKNLMMPLLLPVSIY